LRKKIALFCNVQEKAVVEEMDVAVSIYEVPVMLHQQGLDDLILSTLDLRKRKSDLANWEKILKGILSCEDTVTIGVVGKYTELKDAYKSIWEALNHGAWGNGVKAEIQYIDVERKDLTKKLHSVDGILVPGGFGERGIEGKKKAIRFARENKIPFLGICLGLQCAVIEFAETVCGMKKANSTEFDPRTPYPVIDLIPEQKKIAAKGGTMRLGSYPCRVKKDSWAYSAYRRDLIHERHRHRYELNNRFRRELERRGLRITGEYEQKRLAEIIELREHPWFVAVQFHPEFKSRPNRPNPLFREFVRAAIKHRSDGSRVFGNTG
jgi:CTP synthase